ncbi:MAG: hypothetical protein AB7N76_33255 [Planctomycetota bacterium]
MSHPAPRLLPLLLLCALSGCAAAPLAGVRSVRDEDGTLHVLLDVNAENGPQPLLELRAPREVPWVAVRPRQDDPRVLEVRWPAKGAERQVLLAFDRTGPWDFGLSLLRPHGDPSAGAHAALSGRRPELGTCVLHDYQAGCLGSGGADLRLRLEADGAVTAIHEHQRLAVAGELRPFPDEQVSPPGP